jgi:hypothetical protein
MEEGVEPDRELILEDARSIRERLWRMAHLAQDAARSLDARIEDEALDSLAEAVQMREVLQRCALVLILRFGRRIRSSNARV